MKKKKKRKKRPATKPTVKERLLSGCIALLGVTVILGPFYLALALDSCETSSAVGSIYEQFLLSAIFLLFGVWRMETIRYIILGRVFPNMKDKTIRRRLKEYNLWNRLTLAFCCKGSVNVLGWLVFYWIYCLLSLLACSGVWFSYAFASLEQLFSVCLNLWLGATVVTLFVGYRVTRKK